MYIATLRIHVTRLLATVNSEVDDVFVGDGDNDDDIDTSSCILCSNYNCDADSQEV